MWGNRNRLKPDAEVTLAGITYMAFDGGCAFIQNETHWQYVTCILTPDYVKHMFREGRIVREEQ